MTVKANDITEWSLLAYPMAVYSAGIPNYPIPKAVNIINVPYGCAPKITITAKIYITASIPSGCVD